jgi:hypothetical protein
MTKAKALIICQENKALIQALLEQEGFNDKRKKHVPMAYRAVDTLLLLPEKLEKALDCVPQTHRIGCEAVRDFGASSYRYGRGFTCHPAGYRVLLLRTKKGWEIAEVTPRNGETPGWELTKLTPKAAAAIRKNADHITRLAYATPAEKA